MESYKSEKDFRQNYNVRDIDVPLATVELCIFSIIEQELKVLVAKRDEFPCKGKWTLPGGVIDIHKDRTLDDTARRKLQDKTKVKIPSPYLEQIETIGSKTRDHRGWSMSVLYLALIAHTEAQPVEEMRWVTIIEADKMDLAIDHCLLLKKAIKRLRSKVGYTTLPIHILPREFTLAELQNAYEIIMAREVDKKSFRRRIEAAALLAETGKSRCDGGRPAKLYRLKKGGKTYYYNRSI